MGSGNPGSRKVLLTFSEENTTGLGEVMAFVVNARDLYTLEDLNFTLKAGAFAIPDSIVREMELVQRFSIEEILDSVSRSSSNRGNPEFSAKDNTQTKIPSRPQALDSASLKTLRKITKSF
jgi:hypothetical protein